MNKKYKILNLLLFFLLSISPAWSDVIARLIKVEGKVFFKRLGMETFSEKAKPGAAIINGDQIKIGDEGYAAVIYIDDRSIIKIKENTKFSFMDSPNTRTIDLVHGTLLNKINKEKRTKSFRIQTPVSVASVKGTEFAAIVSQKGIEQFVCKEGSFEVLNMISGQTVNVGPGQKAFSNATGDLVQAVASPKDYPQDPETEENMESDLDEIIETEQKEAQQQNAPPEIEPDTEDSDSKNENDSMDEPKTENPINNEVLENIETPETKKPTPGPPPKPFSMGLGIGSATIDGVLYNQLALRPEINIWKIGIGLDLILYIDNEGNIAPFVKDQWDIQNDPSLILDKILYIKYGQKTDPGWFKYGSLEGITLGYGGLINSYSNMMEFPSVRRVGLNGGFNIGPVGGEIFISNFKDLDRGGTVSGLRMSYTVSDNFPLSVGINYVVDSNMFSALKDKDDDSFPDIFDDFPNDSSMWNDTDGDGYPDPGNGPTVPDSLIDIDADGDNILDANELEDQITLKATPFSLENNKAVASGFSFDIGYPILNSKAISLKIYSEYNSLNFPGIDKIARIERKGTGLTVPGVRSTIFGILNLSLEYRFINDAFIPQFFDQAYDLNRIIVSTKIDSITNIGTTKVQTKDMAVFDDYEVDSSGTNSSGLYGSAGLNLFDLVNFSASYSNMKSDQIDIKSFTAFLNLNTDNIPKISSAMAYYQRNNEENPFDFDNPSKNTIMGYRVGYELSKGVSLIWDFRQYYRDDGTGKLEPIKQTTIETAFNF